MELTISLAGSDVDRMRSLRNWLADEPAVRRYGQMRRAETTEPASSALTPAGGAVPMGDGLDAITLAVSAGLSVTQLLVALAAWRDSRPRRESITIVIECNGVRVTLQGSDRAELERVAKALGVVKAVSAARSRS